MLYPNACQKYSEVMNQPPVTDPASSTTESSGHDTSRSSPYLNACQDYSEVPKPPPKEDPSILDYYWYYYCYYYKYHYQNDSQVEVLNPPPLTTEGFESDMSHSSPCPNACQDSSIVPKPPPVTDLSIV